VFALEVLHELGVVVEPPESRGRQGEEVGSLLPNRLQMSNGRGIVGWVVADVDSVRPLREVPGPPPLDFEELLIAFADHRDRGSGRNRSADEIRESINDLRITQRPVVGGLRTGIYARRHTPRGRIASLIRCLTSAPPS